MAEVKSWNALMNAVKKRVEQTLKNEVFEEVRDVYQKHIDEDVYDVHSPTVYQRRDIGGGLIADENIIGDVNDFVLAVKDIAPLNTSISNSGKQKSYSDTYLANIIENGLANTGHAKNLFNRDMSSEPWANPRPFTQNTINDLKTNKQHIEALKEGLKKRGIKTE